MPKDFQLQLLNTPPNGIYFPGYTVSGTLQLTTDKAKEYKAIQVSLIGFSNVHWTESRGSGSNRHTVSYHSHEDYLNLLAVVWDKNAQGSGGKLPPGSYQWPFTFVLQGPKLPPSYEGSVGKIRYTVAARIVKDALLKINTKAEIRLSVGNIVSVDRPDLLQPQSLSVEKTLCCLCCASAPIHITARIPRTGYCINQDAISVEVDIENGSGREIRNLTAIIKQAVVYTAQGKRRYSFKTIANVPPSDPIPARSTQVWKPPPLQVPLTEISITTCSNISLSYVVEVSASISGALNPKINIPILLGNVPLRASGSIDVQPPAGVYPGAPPPAGVLLHTGAVDPTGGSLPAPAMAYPGPPFPQTTPSTIPPGPAAGNTSYAPASGQLLGFAALSQPTAIESKPPPYSAQLPPGFVDPIKRS